MIKIFIEHLLASVLSFTKSDQSSQLIPLSFLCNQIFIQINTPKSHKATWPTKNQQLNKLHLEDNAKNTNKEKFYAYSSSHHMRRFFSFSIYICRLGMNHNVRRLLYVHEIRQLRIFYSTFSHATFKRERTHDAKAKWEKIIFRYFRDERGRKKNYKNPNAM
jgi:hypothetical protein